MLLYTKFSFEDPDHINSNGNTFLYICKHFQINSMKFKGNYVLGRLEILPEWLKLLLSIQYPVNIGMVLDPKLNIKTPDNCY